MNDSEIVSFFSTIMIKKVPSSTGMERYFSSTGLINSKLRNRLHNDKVAKVVKFYRFFSSKNMQGDTDSNFLDGLSADESEINYLTDD